MLKYEGYTDYTEQYYFDTVATSYIEFDDGSAGLPLREVAKAFYLDDNAVTYENGTIKIAGDKWFGEAFIVPGADYLTVDGEEKALVNPAKIENGITYIDNSVTKSLFGYNLADFRIAIPFDGKIDVSFSKWYDWYGDYDDYEYEEYDYTKNDYFYTYPDYYDDLGYDLAIPIRDMLGGFSVYDVEFDNGIITIRGDMWFDTATAQIGSDKVYIDGVEHTLTTPLYIKNDLTFVDSSFARELFGSRFDEAYKWFDDYYAHFNYKNMIYDEEI